ncbi:MAG: sugar ABC transporter ATP-binding protein [Planctomycetes bacterium]|nr:sugar ABC transporter ATP-binding protein [Planctomycetota bacterium]
MAVLKFNHITKTFPGVTALDAVSFELRAGEILALCGENGAGKSTLIKIIAGVYPAGSYQGKLLIQDSACAFHNTHDAEQAGISVIYQELTLIPELSVAENIFLGHEPKRGPFIDWEKMYGDARELMQQFHIDIDISCTASELGIGQQQLVEIVKALARKSKILLLDEPSAALTEEEVNKLLEIIKELKRQGVSCIYISHKLDEVFALADRICVLRDGKAVFESDCSQSSNSEIIKHMVGREIDDIFPKHSATRGDELLSIKNLNVHSEQGAPILTNINLQAYAGEVLGIGGLMGAGRSELLMHIMNNLGKRHSGTISLNNKDLGHNSTQKIIQMGMVLVSEDRKKYGLVHQQSINFNISISILSKLRNGIFLDSIKEHQVNQQWFDDLQIKAPSLETAVQTLSGGNQQKVVLAKSLICQPQVVLLDEPTRGIDVGAKVEIYNIINDLTAAGKAVILVSSELPELMGMSDRIYMLAEGQISGEFNRDAFEQETLLAAAMGTVSEGHS